MYIDIDVRFLFHILDTGEGSQGSNSQSCSARSCVDMKSPLDFGEGGQVVIQKATTWTIVCNVFGECPIPSTLYINLFCRFRKKSRHIVSSILSQWQLQVVDPPFLSFLYNVYGSFFVFVYILLNLLSS